MKILYYFYIKNLFYIVNINKEKRKKDFLQNNLNFKFQIF